MNNSQCYFGDRLKQLRKDFGLTQLDLSKKIGIVRSAISNYETNRTMPDPTTLNQLAQLFDVSTDYLLGRVDTYSKNSCIPNNDSFSPKFTNKDEKDIAKKLEQIISSMNTDNGLMLYNNDLDEETKELLIASIERTLRQAKLIAKEKFTPKKYRD